MAYRRITWDEDNLTLTSLERGTRQKIDEPKTPFVRSVPDSDSEHVEQESGKFLPPFELSGALQAYKEEDFVSSRFNSENQLQQQNDWDSTDDEGEGEDTEEGREKKRNFALKRQEHYKMKEALMLGKQLVSEDDLDDEDMQVDYRVPNTSSVIPQPARHSVSENSATSSNSSVDLRSTAPATMISVASSHESSLHQPPILSNSNLKKNGSEKHVRIVDSRSRKKSASEL